MLGISVSIQQSGRLATIISAASGGAVAPFDSSFDASFRI